MQYVLHIIHNTIFKFILALARTTPRYHVYRIKKRHKKRQASQLASLNNPEGLEEYAHTYTDSFIFNFATVHVITVNVGFSNLVFTFDESNYLFVKFVVNT